MLTINNIELEVDFLDADVMQRYETALDEVKKNSVNQEQKKGSQIIREQCQSVHQFFDTVFGEGTSEDVFEGRVNLLECLEAFEKVISYANEQMTEVGKIVNKYTPNRAQRRTKK